MDVATYRTKEFPVTDHHIHLNHASYAPIPTRALHAATGYLQDLNVGRLVSFTEGMTVRADEVRALVGQLLHCAGKEIAFIKNTSEGINLAASGLDWQPGDNVITYEKEFPSDVYAWMNLTQKGVELRFVPDRGYRYTVEDLESLIDNRTRVICLSYVNFGHGFRGPMKAVGELCATRDILFVVDGIQGTGALDLNVKEIQADIVSAHGYKWLMSGPGIGFVYLSPKAIAKLWVPQAGWKSIESPYNTMNMLNYKLAFSNEARRIEPGVPNIPGIYTLGASLELLLEVGIPTIERRILHLTDLLITGLVEKGYEVVSSTKPEERSGIVSFVAKGEVEKLQERLATNKIAVSLREGRVRVSPHFYNTEAEIEQLLAVLPA